MDRLVDGHVLLIEKRSRGSDIFFNGDNCCCRNVTQCRLKWRSGDLVFELGLPAALPLVEDLGQLVQASVVEMEDLVLALSAGDHQLPTGARLITARAHKQHSASKAWTTQ